MSLKLPLALLATVAVVHASTPPRVLRWTQVARSAPEGHGGEQSRRPPQAIAFAPDGALLISDTFNHRVLRASEPPSVVTTLESPDDLAVHRDGRLLVADRTRWTLHEIGTTSRAYGEHGTGPLQVLDVARVAFGPDRLTAVADDLGHRIVVFDDAKPARSIPYDSFGFAFDPRGNLVQPRFATLSGFVLSRHSSAGTTLTAQPFDLASPLSIELLEVAADGTALAQVPDPSSMDGRQELLRIEPGGRAHLLWSGHVIDAARSFARHPDGTLWRADATESGFVVAPLPPSVPTTALPTAAGLPAPPALRRLEEVWQVPAASIPDPVGLVSYGGDLWLVGADGRFARGAAAGPVAPGKFELPRDTLLAGATVGPSNTLLLRHAAKPIAYVRGSDKQVTFEGWTRAPDILTCAPGGQLLAHDRVAGSWSRHDITGRAIQRFDGAGAGALDARSELITVQDADEPYSKVVMQFDCNGNFFKALANFKESTRPTGARFVGMTPDTDLVIGYWLGTRGVARRYTSEGTARACVYFDLPSGATCATADWTLDASGNLVLALREGASLTLRAIRW